MRLPRSFLFWTILVPPVLLVIVFLITFTITLHSLSRVEVQTVPEKVQEYRDCRAQYGFHDECFRDLYTVPNAPFVFELSVGALLFMNLILPFILSFIFPTKGYGMLTGWLSGAIYTAMFFGLQVDPVPLSPIIMLFLSDFGIIFFLPTPLLSFIYIPLGLWKIASRNTPTLQ